MTKRRVAARLQAAMMALIVSAAPAMAVGPTTFTNPSPPGADYTLTNPLGTIFGSATVGQIFNFGTIVAPVSAGLSITNHSTVGAVFNYAGGTISATGMTYTSGVDVTLSVVSLFDNAGTISGSSVGISSGTSTIRTLRNGGTIAGAYKGVYLVDTIVDNFTNTVDGKIVTTFTVGGIGLYASRANSTSSFGTFDNSGTIVGTTGGVGVLLDGTNVDHFYNRATGQITMGVTAADNVIGDFDNAGTISGGFDATSSRIGAVTNSGLIGGFWLDGTTATTTLASLMNNGRIVNTEFAGYGFRSYSVAIGDISNTGRIEGNRYGLSITNGTVGSITNGGTIIGAAGQSVGFEARVITSGDTNFIGTFTNSGRIEGGNAGFFVNGLTGTSITFTSLTNSGAIVGRTANGNGANIQFAAIGNFTNSGSIESKGTGVSVSNGMVGAFTNSGTIASSGNASFGGLFASSSTFGSFTNGATGLIQGAGWGLRLSGVTAGAVVNDGRLTATDVTGIGARISSTTLSSLTNDATGVMEGGSTGLSLVQSIITGSLVNNGTIIGGSYGITGNGQFGAFLNAGRITGTAVAGINLLTDATITNTGTIEGAVAIRLDTAGLGTVVNSGVLRGTSGTAIDFAFSSLGPVPPKNDKLTITTGSMIYGAVNFGDGTDTLDFAGFAGTTLMSVPGLDTVVPGGRTYLWDQASAQLAIFDPAWLSHAVANQGTTDIVLGLNAFLATSRWNSQPSETASFSTNYAATGTEATDAIDSAVMTELDVTRGITLWGGFIGGGVGGANPSLYGGLVAGAEARIDATLRLGVLAGFATSTTVFPEANQTLASQTGLVGLYGKAALGVADVDFSLTGGVQAFTSTRQFVGAGGIETARGLFIGGFIAPSAGVTVPVFSADGIDLAVRAAATYVGGLTSAYTESGASMNLSVGNQTISVLDARVGLEGRHDIGSAEGMSGALTAKLGVFGQANSGGASVAVSAFNQTINVATPGGNAVGVYGGVGFDAQLTESLKLTISTDGSFRTDGLSTIAIKGGFAGTF